MTKIGLSYSISDFCYTDDTSRNNSFLVLVLGCVHSIESIKYHYTYPLIGHCGLTSKWLNTDLIMCVHIYFLLPFMVLRLEITIETILSVLYKAVYCYRFGSDANVK